MRFDFPTLLEKPDTGCSIAAVFYDILAFFSLPFILLLFMQGSFEMEAALVGVELVYHILNFFVARFIFREYLKDSLLPSGMRPSGSCGPPPSMLP